MRSAASLGYGVLLALATSWGAGLAAQTAEVPAPTPAQIAKMFKTASDAEARAAAFAALAPFAESGDAAAQRMMARELMKDARYPEALAALAPLIAANDEDGLDMAAKLVGNRKSGIDDPALALDIAERLAELGDLAALGRVAKAHLAGQTGRIPAEKIRTDLQVAVQGGVADLAGLLAGFQSKGIGGPVDQAGAIAALKMVADAGGKVSDLELVNALMNSDAEADLAEAFDLLTNMAQGDGPENLTAKVRLIIGHATGGFGTKSDISQAMDQTPSLMADKAAAKAMGSLLRAAGRSTAAPEWQALVLQTVQDQIAAGDLTHLDALFGHYAAKRDDAAVAAAQALYDSYGEKITSDFRASFVIAQEIRAGNAMAKADDLVQMIAQTTGKSGLEKAYLASIADQNFYVYVLQSLAQTKGYFQGKPSGQMDSATIRAISKLCSDAGVAETCAAGPLKRKNAQVIARAVAGLAAP